MTNNDIILAINAIRNAAEHHKINCHDPECNITLYGLKQCAQQLKEYYIDLGCRASLSRLRPRLRMFEPDDLTNINKVLENWPI
jgi:hypothetical protein